MASFTLNFDLKIIICIAYILFNFLLFKFKPSGVLIKANIYLLLKKNYLIVCKQNYYIVIKMRRPTKFYNMSDAAIDPSVIYARPPYSFTNILIRATWKINENKRRLNEYKSEDQSAFSWRHQLFRVYFFLYTENICKCLSLIFLNRKTGVH